MPMELGNALFGHSRGAHEVDRSLQGMFIGFLEEMGFDGYGYKIDRGYDPNAGFAFENDVFRLQPYWWGECQCPGWDTEEGVQEHQPGCYEEESNFTYKPTGLTISWYKYPFRDSYSSEPLTASKLAKIMEACAASLEKK